MSERTHNICITISGGGMLLKLKNAESRTVVCVEQTLGKRQVLGWFSRIRSSVTFAEHTKHLGCQSNKQKI